MTVIDRLDKAVSSVMGVRLFMQPVQDINIGGRLTATQYQYTLADIDATSSTSGRRSSRTRWQSCRRSPT